MRTFVFVILLFFTMNAGAQEVNKKIQDPNRHTEVMINICTRDGITTFDEFKASYDPNYAAYQPDSATIAAMKTLTKDKKITIVLGTWCGDSKFQVPHFLKVSDALKLTDKEMTIIAVDGTKKAENGLIDKLKIERVPTFIFTDKKGNEIGRIIEHPKENLEKDMLKILASAKTN